MEQSRSHSPLHRIWAGVKASIAWVQSVIHRVQALWPARALARYGVARGGLLSGGIAYSALFSIAAAATIAWTVFMTVLGSNAEFKAQVIEAVNEVLPGFFTNPADPSSTGLIDPDSLVLSSVITPASVIAALVLLWTAISMITSISGSIRAMFGMNAMKENVVLVYVRALGGFLVLVLGIFASASFTLVATALADKLGMGGQAASVTLRVGSVFASLVIDALVVAFLIRVVAIVRVPRRDLLLGCLVAALGTSAIRMLGTTVVGSVSENRLLASFAALATLLLWLNISARILLMAAAFMANPPRPAPVESADQIHAAETPNYVSLTAPHTLTWPHDPLTGSLIGDHHAPTHPPTPDETTTADSAASN